MNFTRTDGTRMPHLVDARLTTDKRRLILFVNDNGTLYTKRITLNKQGAGLSNYHPGGHLGFARGVTVEEGETAPFRRVVRTMVGFYSAPRELAETLILLLWGQAVTLPDWQTPEDVRPVQYAEAAD